MDVDEEKNKEEEDADEISVTHTTNSGGGESLLHDDHEQEFLFQCSDDNNSHGENKDDIYSRDNTEFDE